MITRKVGYQGDLGSNAEAAAKLLLAGRDVEAKLVPLTSSRNVIDALKSERIDFGVFAMENNIGGTVSETSLALEGEHLFQMDSVTMEIHHCVFAAQDASSISSISSHPQAFAQCTEFIKKTYPNAELNPVADTALSAQMLADGRLGKDVAVMCRKNAGEMYGLKLLNENVENAVSLTTFSMFSLSYTPLSGGSHAMQ